MRVCARHNLVSLLGNKEGWRVEIIFHLSDPHTLTSAYPCHEWKGGREISKMGLLQKSYEFLRQTDSKSVM